MGPAFHTQSPARATLLSISGDAVGTLATITRGYSQVYEPTIDPEEVKTLLEQLDRTALHGPLEFIQLIWLIKNVTRSFTHQLVRYRIGTQFVQESLRFSEKRDPEFLLPPSVVGREALYEVYTETLQSSMQGYNRLLREGVPVEDARGLLPHSILTSVFFGCSLATFAHIFEQRTCCQAQHGEWTPLVKAMRNLLPLELQQFVKYPWETGKASCGFGASFDRKCIHLNLFQKG